MATFAIGDIHGNLPALEDLLHQIRRECRAGDTVVFLGDYIDRGPDGRGCVDAILAWRNAIEATVVCLLGNHEDWLLRTRRDYGRHSWLLAMDAFATIRSYSVDAARVLREALSEAGLSLYIRKSVALPYEAFFRCVPEEHIRFFESLRPYHRNADGVYAHGGLDPQVARVEDQEPEALMWGAPTFPGAYEGTEIVVYGHWNNAVLDPAGWPRPAILDRTIGVDTISHGVLTAMRLPDRRIFQSARYRIMDEDG
jgi:Calcineurin-like phosphoesterase